MRIGIDFGTTHTSAAVYTAQGIDPIPLDPLNQNLNVLRSLIYIDKAHHHVLGVQAAREFLAHDTGRPVIYAEKMVGTIENTVARRARGPLDPDGPITIVYDVVIDDDIGIRGRLLQSIKTGLRLGAYEGTDIFGRYYSIQELIALILGHVRMQAEAYLQTDVRAVTLGRPVKFADEPGQDQQAEQHLRTAAEIAGFDAVSFVPEPVAAAAFYLKQMKRPETVLVFDFGGGTLDLTIMRANAQGMPEVLATCGVMVGGDDLDSALMRVRVAPYFGTESNIDRNYDGAPMPFPEELAGLLNNWQTIPMLSRPKHLAIIRRAKQYGDAKKRFAALECLVTKNYGFALFEQIEQVNRALSVQQQACLGMTADEIALRVDIARSEFNRAIGDEVALTRRGSARCGGRRGHCRH